MKMMMWHKSPLTTGAQSAAFEEEWGWWARCVGQLSRKPAVFLLWGSWEDHWVALGIANSLGFLVPAALKAEKGADDVCSSREQNAVFRLREAMWQALLPCWRALLDREMEELAPSLSRPDGGCVFEGLYKPPAVVSCQAPAPSDVCWALLRLLPQDRVAQVIVVAEFVS